MQQLFSTEREKIEGNLGRHNSLFLRSIIVVSIILNRETSSSQQHIILILFLTSKGLFPIMTTRSATRSLLLAAVCAVSMTTMMMAGPASAFTSPATVAAVSRSPTAATTPLFMSDDFLQETAEMTQERIQALVDNHPVLLFMKGSKLFPQCGFSNTACQILNSFDIDFHSVDVLSDSAIRAGVKDFSQWPTIPQLYVAGEFIGGSDIMIEMYQNGELGEMIEKAKGDMM
jgi:monothiol glutaredoxin